MNNRLDFETGLDWLVRGLGVVLIVAGMWSAVLVIVEAWTLYSDPLRIERFANAVEQGSNLDRALASPASADDAGADIRISYFLAWLIALPLLLLVGMLALYAVRVGAGLARPASRSPPAFAAPADSRRPRIDNLEAKQSVVPLRR